MGFDFTYLPFGTILLRHSVGMFLLFVLSVCIAWEQGDLDEGRWKVASSRLHKAMAQQLCIITMAAVVFWPVVVVYTLIFLMEVFPKIDGLCSRFGSGLNSLTCNMTILYGHEIILS